MLKKYEKFISIVDEYISEFFSTQKDFIKCQKGCGLCCKESAYVTSQIEYEYLKFGIKNLLSPEQIEEIKKKTVEIIENKEKYSNGNKHDFSFKYICPLLINNSCSIYEFRPIICKIYGLILDNSQNLSEMNLPNCVNYGLNYSNVYDVKKQKFIPEKFTEHGIKALPKALKYTDIFNFAEDISMFGDVKLTVEWLYEDILKGEI